MTLQKMTVCLILMALLLSGCGGGGDGGGPKEAVVTVKVSPNPVTKGEPYTDNEGKTGLKWYYTLTFTESNGVGATITTLDWEIKGDNGYTGGATAVSMNPVSIPANGSIPNNWSWSLTSTSGEQKFSTATIKITLYGTDDNENSIECSVEIVVYWQT